MLMLNSISRACIVQAVHSCSAAVNATIFMTELYSQTKEDYKVTDFSRLMKPQIFDALKKVTQFFVDNCGADESVVNETSVMNAYGLIETNSLGFGNLEARGVYPMVSLMSHDCAPNLFPMSNPGEAVAFRAKRLINRGEELTIRYTNFVECKLCIRHEVVFAATIDTMNGTVWGKSVILSNVLLLFSLQGTIKKVLSCQALKG